jgi:hypothetical protein
MIDKGRFTVRRAGLATGNGINAGSPASGAPTRGRASLVAFRALTRPVPGDGVLPVVDMRDTVIVGHRNFAIEHDLGVPARHVVNRSEPGSSPPISRALLPMVAEGNKLHPSPMNHRVGDRASGEKRLSRGRRSRSQRRRSLD